MIDKKDFELLKSYEQTIGLYKFNNEKTDELEKIVNKIALRLNLQHQLFK